ncbi:helix-turn-helix domain-containing protein, partial [Streptomyces sp. BE147]|uniref:helix-turn-helix transcriptional regulator n=1 Tax=Streptomyces sp. BE147 TaxID=3002524 RepID=UPI002E764E1B
RSFPVSTPPAPSIPRGGQTALPLLVEATPAGTGGWDATDEQRTVLALRANGLSVAACARQAGLPESKARHHLSACKETVGVSEHRALVHEALRAGVLVLLDPPTATGSLLPAGVDREVLRGLILDVPPAELPSAIMRSKGRSYIRVCDTLDALRRVGVPDCRLVVLGWQWNVLDATHSVRPPEPDESGSSLTAETDRTHTAVAADGAGVGSQRGSLTPRQHEALRYVVEGLTDEEAAGRMGINPPSLRGHLVNCRARAGVETDRALIHMALKTGQVQPPQPQGLPEWRLRMSEAWNVWRAMVLDAPDTLLGSEIARKLRIPRQTVDCALTDLRSSGLSDRQLIRAGWACGVLDADADVTPRSHTGQLLSSPAPSTPRAAPTGPAPLALVPPGMAWRDPFPPSPGPHPLHGTVNGGDFALLIVQPEVCRAFLRQVGAEQWGPVLARPETGTALLVAHAHSVPIRWRTPRGRRAAAHTRLHLPGEHTPGREGSHWAVPPTAPLWTTPRLHWLLDETNPTTPGDHHE